jgi:choice-of-anchor B domain-containing protein
MRFSTLSGAVLSAASLAMARELPKDEFRAAKLYDNRLMHNKNMESKKAKWQAEYDAGLLNSTQWPRLDYTKCVNGKAEAVKGDPLQTFKCRNMDLYDFINHATLGSPNGRPDTGIYPFLTGSGSWGWVDPESGREFVASGMYDGTALLEILPEGRFVQLGFLPCPAPIGNNALWKELRGYKNYMLIGSELRGHGVQIFDMSKLLDIPHDGEVRQFDAIKDLTGHFMDLPDAASHNVVVSEESEYGVAVGSRPTFPGSCAGGLIFFDLKDPANPVKLGCNPDDGYVHDAQCLVYRGPHEKYVGRDVCYGYNEDTLTIYDVTDKANSSIISITSYEGATYTHQGWVLDPMNQEYLVMDDEIDELERAGPAADTYAVTYIWDIRDLENPKQTGLYKSTTPATDHNQYVRGDLVYQSNYMSGIRVYDISSIPSDPTGDSVCEIAYFDIYPEDDDAPGGGIADMYGSWSSYQFPSGFVFVNTIERGAYLVKLTKRESCKPKTCNADNCLRAMRASSVEGRLEESQEFCGDFLDGWNADVAAVPTYASSACGSNVISRVSSACSCIATATPTA